MPPSGTPNKRLLPLDLTVSSMSVTTRTRFGATLAVKSLSAPKALIPAMPNPASTPSIDADRCTGVGLLPVPPKLLLQGRPLGSWSRSLLPTRRAMSRKAFGDAMRLLITKAVNRPAPCRMPVPESQSVRRLCSHMHTPSGGIVQCIWVFVHTNAITVLSAGPLSVFFFLPLFLSTS